MFGRDHHGATIGTVGGVIDHTEAGAPLPASEAVAPELQRPRAIAAWHKELDAYQAQILDRVLKAHAVSPDHHRRIDALARARSRGWLQTTFA